MMRSLIFFTLFLSFFAANSIQNSIYAADNAEKNGEEVLQKLYTSLNELKNIRYNHKRWIDYLSKSVKSETAGSVYLDFTSHDKVMGARYCFQGGGFTLVFNGSESFTCNESDKTITIDRTPERGDFEYLSFLNHSIFSLRKALPWIIADQQVIKHLGDTMYDNTPCYIVRFVLRKDVIGTLGDRWDIEEDIDIMYRIFVRKQDYLPVGTLQTNNRNSDFLRTSFSNIRVNTELEDESVFYYSSYLGKYKEKQEGEGNALIKAGQPSVDWELRSLDTGSMVSLSGLKGNVVLLQFWICHCGYCIAEIPLLNALHNKYKKNNFRLVAINAYDSPELVRQFREKMKPMDYEILMKGEEVRLKYGVGGFPTVVLLDKKGIVLYAGPFDAKKIEELVEKNF